MPSGTVPIWAKPKYIIPSFKCKFLLYHIIEPCYLRVAKQYQMVVRCSLAGICGFSCLATCFTTCKLLNYIVQLFVSLAQYSLSLLIAILHAFTRWVPTTGWAMCWIAWIPFGKCISQSVLLPLFGQKFTAPRVLMCNLVISKTD